MKIPVLLAVVTLAVFIPTMVFLRRVFKAARCSRSKVRMGSFRSWLYMTVRFTLVFSHSFFPCDNNLVTDAYVLQGGSAIGCDSGDALETFPSPASSSSLGVDTNLTYRLSIKPQAAQETRPMEPICANPDTGFLTVTNNGTSSFSGTITLSGNSSVDGTAVLCDRRDGALDTWTSGTQPRTAGT